MPNGGGVLTMECTEGLSEFRRSPQNVLTNLPHVSQTSASSATHTHVSGVLEFVSLSLPMACVDNINCIPAILYFL